MVMTRHAWGVTNHPRLISAFAGALLVGSGLLIYGFTALKTHFIVVSIAVIRRGNSNLTVPALDWSGSV
jgi:hypothetical protein